MPEPNFDHVQSTPSELLHALTLGRLRDPDSYSPEEYIAAYDVVRRLHPDLHQAADPTAAQVERQQTQRRIDAKASNQEEAS